MGGPGVVAGPTSPVCSFPGADRLGFLGLQPRERHQDPFQFGEISLIRKFGLSSAQLRKLRFELVALRKLLGR